MVACHLEKVVPGCPRPTGGDDDGLILPDLDQSPLQKRNGGIGTEGQACPWLIQGVGGRRQQVTGPTEPERELMVLVRGK